jgi:hypothetical protein
MLKVEISGAKCQFKGVRDSLLSMSRSELGDDENTTKILKGFDTTKKEP